MEMKTKSRPMDMEVQWKGNGKNQTNSIRHPHPSHPTSVICSCIPMSTAIKLVAFSAVILGIGVTGVGGWVLHRSIQAWRNPTLVTAHNLLSQVNTFFGGTTGLYDLDVIYRILTSCSAVCFIAGIVQFFVSFWLFLAVTRGGQTIGKVWLITHCWVMIVVAGSFLCILTNELQIDSSLTVFLAVSGANFLLIIPFSVVVLMFCQDQGDTLV